MKIYYESKSMFNGLLDTNTYLNYYRRLKDPSYFEMKKHILKESCKVILVYGNIFTGNKI